MALGMAMRVMPFRQPELIGLDVLTDELAARGINKILLITIDVLCENEKYKALMASLSGKGIGCEIFDKVTGEPTSELTDKIVKAYREGGCKAIVAIGGGSVIDCAKIAGAVIATGKTPAKLQGLLHVRKKLPYLVAVPTTAGTGSEATLAAVVTDSATGHKASINSFPLIPEAAVLEPAFTEGLPPFLTATTGLDALTHAIEAYIGRGGTKKTDRLAVSAVKLIFENLPKAYENGHNLAALKNMLLASYEAGCAFTRAFVGYVHAIGHALGAKYHIGHGHAMSVVLPVVLEAYGKSAHKKLARLARCSGVITQNLTDPDAAYEFISRIRDLNDAFGIPSGFDCLKEEDIPALAETAAKEANPLYPVPIEWDAKEIEKVIRRLKI